MLVEVDYLEEFDTLNICFYGKNKTAKFYFDNVLLDLEKWLTQKLSVEKGKIEARELPKLIGEYFTGMKINENKEAKN